MNTRPRIFASGSFSARSLLLIGIFGLLATGLAAPTVAGEAMATLGATGGAIRPHTAADASVAGLPDDPTEEGTDKVPPLTPERAALLAAFQDPVLSATQTAEILARYAHVDPRQVIFKALRDRALVYFDVNRSLVQNTRSLSVIDFSLPSKTARFHIIDLASGAVVSLHSAHGQGSDPQNTGSAVTFSNTPKSKMSSLGFYLTAETYDGSHGLSLRLDGLSPTNSNARPRAIVVHGADYVEDADVKQGRSWGCPAVSMEAHRRVIEALQDGSLILGAVR